MNRDIFLRLDFSEAYRLLNKQFQRPS